MLSSGPRVTDRLPGRNADSRRTICSPRGSATVEAAVVIPIFMIALFSLAYIIKCSWPTTLCSQPCRE